MKNFARCLLILCLFCSSSNLYAQEWVPYNPYIQQQPTIQTVYVQPQPIIVYQWTPYTVQQNIVVEQKRLFCVNQTVISRPVVQWILQPVIIYR